jgi:hypothetical protein
VLKNIFLLTCRVAVRVATAFVTSAADHASTQPRPFIYISAEDIFRPIIPAAYIETKREAEEQIERLMGTRTDYRGVYMRPSERHLNSYRVAWAE